jgi:prephenate dehydrogenase
LLWTDILKENADHVAARLKSVAAGLESFAQALLSGDSSAISEKLSQGNRGRDRLPGKHGSGTKSHSSLVVRLEDKPGELARLFQAAAAAEVNLEDVRIDHSLGRMTGLVELSVAPSSRDTLISALTSAAFVVVS